MKKVEENDRQSAERESASWYVCCTHSNAERLAKHHLERQGFEVYLPMMHGPKVKGQETVKPFLQGYLFVSVNLDKPGWRAIHSTIGISRLLCVGDRPKAAPTALVQAIMDREVFGLIKLPPRVKAKAPARDFKKGDAVKVEVETTDRITGITETKVLDGLFDESVDGKRAFIFTRLLGSDSRTLVALASLK